jgi:RNA polymerase sigma-70 factor (ECF subfamily)
MTHPTPPSLLDRLQGEACPDDWSLFVSLYQPFIERFIRLDPVLVADADDICQNVLRKIVEHLPRFRRQRDGSFRAWLRVITANEVNYYWRQRRRARAMGTAGFASSVLIGLTDPVNELSQRWDREHSRYVLARLQELVKSQFSATTWQAFHMRVIDDKSAAEVAAILGISENAVHVAKSRVLGQLRREAAGFIDDAI